MSGGEFCQVVSSVKWWVLAVGEFWQVASFIRWWVLSGGEFCQVVSSVRWWVLAVLHLIEVLISWLSSRGGLMNYLACRVQIWWMPVSEFKHRFRLPLFSLEQDTYFLVPGTDSRMSYINRIVFHKQNKVNKYKLNLKLPISFKFIQNITTLCAWVRACVLTYLPMYNNLLQNKAT